MPEDQITIFLTTPEAIMFRDFQKFHATFALLISKGVFDIEYGNATLNFHAGELQNITKQEVVYHKTPKA